MKKESHCTNNEPTISVVMAVYNGARYLRESINSIVNQTFSNFEFIIIDDASSDKTPAILAAYAARDNRIKILYNDTNIGIAASLNHGLNHAKGAYIARHDADDISMAWRLQVQYEFMERNPEYFLCGGTAIRINEARDHLGHYSKPLGESAVVSALTKEMNNHVIHPSMFFRNRHHVRYREKFLYSQDYDFLLNLLSHGLRIFNLPMILLEYRQCSTSGRAKKCYQQLLYTRAAFQFYQERSSKGIDSYSTYNFSECEANEFPVVAVAADTPVIAGIQLSTNATGKELRYSVYNAFSHGHRDIRLFLLLGLSYLSSGMRDKLRSFKNSICSKFAKKKSFPGVALLASLGGGIATWQKVGTLTRELAIFEHLVNRGWLVSFYTYDRKAEKNELLSKIKIHTGLPIAFPSRFMGLQGVLLAVIKILSGRQHSIIVTNQAHSGWPAIIMGWLWKCHVVARCGYVLGERVETLKIRKLSILKAVKRECWTHKNARLSFIPTPSLLEWCEKNINSFDPNKAQVVPNFIDTNLFKTSNDKLREIDVLVVGRLDFEKRYDLILEAMKDVADVKIVIIGDGPCREEIKQQAKILGLNVKFLSRVSNNYLPEYYNLAKIYLIASAWEGHPKSLLEAMACGCACIGTNSPGIKNQIVHEANGLLCASSSKEIAASVKRLLEDDTLRKQLGMGSRQWVCDNYSFDKVFHMYEDAMIKILVESQ